MYKITVKKKQNLIKTSSELVDQIAVNYGNYFYFRWENDGKLLVKIDYLCATNHSHDTFCIVEPEAVYRLWDLHEFGTEVYASRDTNSPVMLSEWCSKEDKFESVFRPFHCVHDLSYWAVLFYITRLQKWSRYCVQQCRNCGHQHELR